jgi:hypothetical protein
MQEAYDEDKFLREIQRKKMKELWNNKEDEEWQSS